MNILVCVKHVPDTETAVKIGADSKIRLTISVLTFPTETTDSFNYS